MRTAALLLTLTACATPTVPASRIVATPETTPSPTPTAVPVPPVVSPHIRPGVREPSLVLSHEAPTADSSDIVALIREAFGANAATALRIARCESNLLATARNRSSGARGLFQLHPGHWDGRWNGKPVEFFHGHRWSEMFDAAANIAVAFGLSRGGADWTAWECR